MIKYRAIFSVYGKVHKTFKCVSKSIEFDEDNKDEKFLCSELQKIWKGIKKENNDAVVLLTCFKKSYEL